MDYKCIGKEVKRYDGLSHVKGDTRYVNDIYIPGTLVAKAYRSPVIKGKVKKIDTSAAERLPGVACVITNKDIPNPLDDQPILAKFIRYKGEPIAAVAAVDEDTALEALSLIKVDIEEQEPVLDPIEAMKPGAPKVRPEGNLYKFGGRDFVKIDFGDVEAGFKESDYIIEEEYFHPPQEHAQLEPNVCLAVPEADRLIVYTPSQSLHKLVDALFTILHKDTDEINKVNNKINVITKPNDIRCIGGFCGGGFGGKFDPYVEPIPCVLALKSGKPVKWHWTREEDLLYSTYRGSWHVKIKDGVKKDGRIIARQMRSFRDAGAYTGLNPYVTEKHCFLANGPYYIPNIYVEGYCVYTNKPMAAECADMGLRLPLCCRNTNE